MGVLKHLFTRGQCEAGNQLANFDGYNGYAACGTDNLILRSNRSSDKLWNPIDRDSGVN